MPRHLRAAVCVWMLAAAALAILAAGLPADGFFVGDSGVKLIAARNALAHPLHPFDIDIPVIGGVPAPELMDPFFIAHGRHAHAETSAVFPLLTAPFLALFGLRGVFVLPMAGFLGALAGLALLARRLQPSSSPAAVIALGLACCPLLFYGLEFWEHSLAAGLAYFGTALIAGTDRRRSRMLESGLLLGGSIVIRPEALWYTVAVLAALRALAMPWPSRALISVGAGIALPLLLFLTSNLIHFHSALGPHVGGNLAAIGEPWLTRRLMIAREWIDPATGPSRFIIATAMAAALTGRLVESERVRRAVHAAVWLACLALAYLAARRGLPRESMWAALPACLLLLGAWPGDTDLRNRRALRFLNLTVAIDVVLVAATAPNDGGGQWGPRYLMLASGPAVLGIWFTLRSVLSERRHLQRCAAGLLIAASLLVQRQAYKELRAAKQYYSRLQQEVLAETGGRAVLTDLWWLDQVTAATSPTPLFLFASDRDHATIAVRLLDRAHTPSFSIVRAHGVAGADQIAGWLDGSGFRIVAERELTESSLAVFRVDRRPAP